MRTRSTPHRLLGVLVRTAHLAGVVGVFAAARTGGPAGPWAAGVVVTGLALAADELWRHGLDWLRWAQAWALGAKLVVFAGAVAWGRPEVGFWAALVVGSVVSHGPGALRHRGVVGAPGPCAAHPPEATARAPAEAAAWRRGDRGDRAWADAPTVAP